MLSLRNATLNDAKFIFALRDNQEIRQHSFNSASFTYEEHLNWFTKVLQDCNHIVLIAEKNNATLIGVVRFSITGNNAKISIFIDPSIHGKGFGTELLILAKNWLKTNNHDIHTIIAEIMPDNIASKKAFEKSGYVLSHYVYKQDI